VQLLLGVLSSEGRSLHRWGCGKLPVPSRSAANGWAAATRQAHPLPGMPALVAAMLGWGRRLRLLGLHHTPYQPPTALTSLAGMAPTKLYLPCWSPFTTDSNKKDADSVSPSRTRHLCGRGQGAAADGAPNTCGHPAPGFWWAGGLVG
jgi:hypothetical protein